MNCHKCGGLMVADHDRESLTGERCINCGSPGGGIKPMPAQENCKRPKCDDPKAEDSVYCPKHRDMKRAANAREAAKRKGVSVTPAEKKPRNRKPPETRLKESPPPSPVKQENGHPGIHIDLTAAYIRETIARLQGDIRQLEQTLSVLAVLASPHG